MPGVVEYPVANQPARRLCTLERSRAIQRKEEMGLSKGEKNEIIEKFAIRPGDTGSSEVQIAVLTRRINQLNEHLKLHKHDQSSRHGLLKLVGQRRSHLKYLMARNPAKYRQLLAQLGLRK
jgi:small subunit ribosomal protein S15